MNILKAYDCQSKRPLCMRLNDMLNYSSPRLTWLLYGILIAVAMFHGIVNWQYNLLTSYVLFSAGLKCWTLFEYVAHRFIVGAMSRCQAIDRICFCLHLDHQYYPNDKRRLFMPIVPGFGLVSTLFVITYLLLSAKAFIFFPGLLMGHLVQLSIHYAIHTYPVPHKCLKYLWQYHLLHHTADHRKGFGITSSFWDHVFATNFRLKSVKSTAI